MKITVQDKRFLISTDGMSYGMEVAADGTFAHLYWGEPLERIEDLTLCRQVRHDPRFEYDGHPLINQEYQGAGGYFFEEPCLKVEYADGYRDTKLFYDAYSIDETPESMTLCVTLKEEIEPLRVRLFYRIYPGIDVLDRWSEVENTGDGVIRLDDVKSAVYYWPRSERFRLTHMHGKWAAEYQLQRVNIGRNRTVIDTRRGISGHYSAPWFAVDSLDTPATETEGRVWAGSIHWSGNWKISAEVDHDLQTRLTAGINDYDFVWMLNPGETFTAPKVTSVFSKKGFSGASRLFHRYQLDILMPRNKARQLRPVKYNSWSVFEFDIDEQQQMKLAEKAAKLGVELFVMDDGWFGARDGEHAGLGDWYPSPRKFPNGLAPLVDHVNSLGMIFGIWVEPEMVNPDSDLYRAHPDWVLHCEGKHITECRWQYVLNFAREDVYQFAWGFIKDLLSNYKIGYLKWDMNRYLCEVDWPEVPAERRRELWTRYVYNVHRLFAQIQEAFPNVLLENCASGSGRMDMGMLKNCDFIATTDCGDPLDKAVIFEGYSQAFSPKFAGHWLGDNPENPAMRRVPAAFRQNLGLSGCLSIGINLLKKTDDELEQIRKTVSLYKEIRETVQHGDLYRLASINDGIMSVIEFARPDGEEAVAFVFGKSMYFRRPVPRIRLQGLLPEAKYSVNGARPVSGRALMTIGTEIYLKYDFDSVMLRINKVEE